MKYSVQIHHDYMHNGFVVFATSENSVFEIKDARLTATKPEMGRALPPLLTVDYFDRDLLQAMADALATAGFFPQSHDQTKELDATREHLKDMRAIALRAVTIHLNHFENAPAGAKP